MKTVNAKVENLNVEVLEKDLPRFKLWSVDRFGRLISGLSILFFSCLSVVEPWFVLGVMLTGTLLVSSSIFNKCFVHGILVYFGAVEREDLFEPGGKLRDVLVEKPGMEKTNGVMKKRKVSAASQAIKAIDKDFRQSGSYEKKVPSVDYTISVVSSMADRVECYKLAHRVYVESGYIDKIDSGMYVKDYDAFSDTISFIVKDLDGAVVGTVSVVRNNFGTLACEESFSEEVAGLRENSEAMFEINRLVIDTKFRNSKSLLKDMINHIFAYTYTLDKESKVLVECQPKHGCFYTRFLGFKQVGDEKPCGRVRGIVAALLCLNSQDARDMINDARAGNGKRVSLWSSMVSETQEVKMVEKFKSVDFKMSDAEINYFGLKRPFQNIVKMA
ncbi:MAG: hypothetical protein COA79_16100 [Planctomycetota bacterium]|nr:MAG: hypothetical protein COA79_16100 [Planctomycetota bacterium]